jgi:hypothetical protein
MSVGEMSVGQMSVGQMSVGLMVKLLVRYPLVRRLSSNFLQQNVCWQNVDSAAMSIHRNTVDQSLNQMSLGKRVLDVKARHHPALNSEH